MIDLPWISAVATAAYFMLTAGVFQLLNWGVPSWLEQILSFSVAPAAMLLTVWNPVLKRLGLTQGEWIVVPGPIAFFLLMMFYAVVAYFATMLICGIFRR